MMEPRVRKVVIAGGGTAGWCAAAALSRQLGALVDVTLVESDAIGTIGVGEATIPTIHAFHRILGVDETEFVRATGATFKLGIAFENWARDGDRYIHSFGEVGTSTWMGGFQHFWLRARDQGFAGPLGDYCLELRAAEEGRFGLGAGMPALNYAYHLDATAYARFLRTLAEGAGCVRAEGKIARVHRDGESGLLTALELEDGTRIEGDLFLDCTGFRALLLGETLGVGYEDWSEWLATDSAVAVQSEATGPALPYTRAIAHRAGWRWRIPLQHRVGNGVVYARDHFSDDEARAMLLAAVDGPVRNEPRLLRFRAGRRHRPWEANCIAMGLASGFLEPLESTSIHLMMIGITRLLQLFPFDGAFAALRDRFNALANDELERVRDFIILHYRLTERRDSPFWDRCRTMEIPASLENRIALFRDAAHAYQDGGDLFRVDSWVQVMLGQRLEPQGWHRMAQIMPRDRLEATLATIRDRVTAAAAQLPAHEEMLRRLQETA